MACCAQCVYMDLNDRDSDGWCYCGKKGSYYPPSDSTCWSFEERSDGGGCYLTTLVCNILGYADNGVILNTFRDFRDKIMNSDPQYKDLLLQYDTLGPKLVKCIEAASSKQSLAEEMKSMYIMPVYESLQKNNYKKAVDKYKEMVLFLEKYYATELAVIA